MTVQLRFRDVIRAYVPVWLSDRLASGKTTAFRFLWSMIAPLDNMVDAQVQGLQAAWPGKGTPTALPYIGRSRGLIQGQTETDDAYAARLPSWLDIWPHAAGTPELALAKRMQEYLGNTPRIRVIQRKRFTPALDSLWVTLNSDGSVVKQRAPWNWDESTPHQGNPDPNDPAAPFWSDLWVVVYPTQWTTLMPHLGVSGSVFTRSTGMGHLCARKEVDELKSLIATWKGAHTRVRAVIWTSDAALFDPSDSTTCPDGTWGRWSKDDGMGGRIPARNRTTCRYWEPA
jgi:hypothetical protein